MLRVVCFRDVKLRQIILIEDRRVLVLNARLHHVLQLIHQRLVDIKDAQEGQIKFSVCIGDNVRFYHNPAL